MPRPRKAPGHELKAVTVRFSQQVYDAVAKRAEEDRRPVSVLIGIYVEHGLNECPANTALAKSA